MFNVTDEQITRVHNGAYLIEGYDHETTVLMQRVSVTDSFGSDDYAAFVQQSKGALFTCKFCNVDQTV